MNPRFPFGETVKFACYDRPMNDECNIWASGRANAHVVKAVGSGDPVWRDEATRMNGAKEVTRQIQEAFAMLEICSAKLGVYNTLYGTGPVDPGPTCGGDIPRHSSFMRCPLA